MGLNMADFGSFGYVKMTGDTPENIDPLADDTSVGASNEMLSSASIPTQTLAKTPSSQINCDDLHDDGSSIP